MQTFLALLILFAVFCCNSEATESQWSLLRQDEYDVKLEVARVDYVNSSYLKYAKFDAVPYNRTFRVLNGSLEFRLDLEKQILIGVQIYKFLSNEYRFFPITFEFDLCTEYTHDSFGIKQLLDGVSNIQPCFFKKNVHYQLINTLPDFSKFPPHIPLGRYSSNLNFVDKTNRNSMMVAVVDHEIKEKPKIWKM